jgi:hypothetical protein
MANSDDDMKKRLSLTYDPEYEEESCQESSDSDTFDTRKDPKLKYLKPKETRDTEPSFSGNTLIDKPDMKIEPRSDITQPYLGKPIDVTADSALSHILQEAIKQIDKDAQIKLTQNTAEKTQIPKRVTLPSSAVSSSVPVRQSTQLPLSFPKRVALPTRTSEQTPINKLQTTAKIFNLPQPVRPTVIGVDQRPAVPIIRQQSVNERNIIMRPKPVNTDVNKPRPQSLIEQDDRYYHIRKDIALGTILTIGSVAVITVIYNRFS